MSKNEQVSKSELLLNIKSLIDFENDMVNPLIKDYDTLRDSIDKLTVAIREKKDDIRVKLDNESAKLYEEAMKEAANEQEQDLDIQEETTLEIPIEESTKEKEPIQGEEAQAIVNKPPKMTVEPKKEDSLPKVHKKANKEDRPKKALSLEDKIPELKFKSRPKTEKEKAINRSRVFIPDSSTKPSGQPINNRRQYNNDRPNYRRDQKPDGDKRPFPRPRLNIKDAAQATPSTVFKAKDTRVARKRDRRPEDGKKGMDKRTLIRRGFIDNRSPGAALDYDYDVRHFKARKKRDESKPKAIQIEKAVVNSEIVPIKVLSERIGKSGASIIKQLFVLGIVKTINESIDFDTAELVANELGVELELKPIKSSEDILAEQIDIKIDEDNLKPRPPVVTIMGHVDHGKTSVLDYIRKSKVVASEAGGITQHIGAYMVDVKGQKITFLDTPGHAAFTSMRLRGAQATDIVVIVVAADDGIMPQTIEAIAHAKASDVSIIIAINKMDKRTANPDRIKQQLTEHDLLPEEWGGDTMCVPISAITGEGIDNLLESIVLLAEIKELKADYKSNVKGIIIEAQLDKGMGPVATVLVQSGTLRVKDNIVAGTVIGKIRAMTDDKGKRIKSATPSMPVQIQGFSEVPQAGDLMVSVEDERLAKKVIDERKDILKSTQAVNKTGTSLEEIFSRIAEGEIKDLNIIVKGDVQGSVEAIKQELGKLSNDEVRVNIVQSNVGAVTESDVMLAESSSSIIIAFNVRPDPNAKKLAERNNIDIRVYRIIYDIINDINLALKGMLKPVYKEKVIGRAEVRAIFKISGAGTIAGCYVIEDKIIRNAKARLLRDNVIVYEGDISSLKRHKDDAKEVAQGYECGISIAGFNDVKENDIIEAFILEEEGNE